MSDILGRIRSGAGKVAKEADKAVDIKRIELQISSINKQLEEEYQKLGQIVYDNNLLGPEESEASSMLAKISDLKQQIMDKEKEISDIKDQTEVSAPAAAASGKKFCSECGAQNDANNKFCSSCGAKMQ